jgi:excisionase family DNA binding protein
MSDPLLQLQSSPKLAFHATESAPYLGLDPRTVRRACESGQIPAFKVGRQWLISKETLLRLLGAQVA